MWVSADTTTTRSVAAIDSPSRPDLAEGPSAAQSNRCTLEPSRLLLGEVGTMLARLARYRPYVIVVLAALLVTLVPARTEHDSDGGSVRPEAASTAAVPSETTVPEAAANVAATADSGVVAGSTERTLTS